MKLGLMAGAWRRDGRVGAAGMTLPEFAALAAEAEGWGFESVWVPESYGGEAFTQLGYLAAATRKARLGSFIMPIWARSPTNCAQAWATLDHISAGRAIAALGVSGPAVAEGWSGRRFEKPVANTREYIAVMRKVLNHEHPTNKEGRYFPLPVPGGSTGITQAIRSTVKPLRADLPILIGSFGPQNVALTAEVADGWAAGFFAPERGDLFKAWLDEGFARPGARRSWKDFQVVASVRVIVDDDIERAAEGTRRHLALYLSAMGTSERNFQYELFARMGFDAEANRIRTLWNEGRKAEAAAAVTLPMVDAIALVGSKARIRDGLAKWKSSFVTTLAINGDREALRTVAEFAA
jgi:F420-dependent oxidoreductase-like protein